MTTSKRTYFYCVLCFFVDRTARAEQIPATYVFSLDVDRFRVHFFFILITYLTRNREKPCPLARLKLKKKKRNGDTNQYDSMSSQQSKSSTPLFSSKYFLNVCKFRLTFENSYKSHGLELNGTEERSPAESASNSGFFLASSNASK
jgi:hypothetical protein